MDEILDALERLGQVDVELSQDDRRLILEACLSSVDAWVRDGAGLGLACLDDHRAATALARAIDNEPIDELRQDLQKVFEQVTGRAEA